MPFPRIENLSKLIDLDYFYQKIFKKYKTISSCILLHLKMAKSVQNRSPIRIHEMKLKKTVRIRLAKQTVNL
jgi:hypothetical protein